MREAFFPSKKVLAWRFLSGAHLDGHRRTNATWLKRATRPRGELNWWTAKPRLYRAFWRWGWFTSGVFSMWLLINHPFVFWSLLMLSAGAFIRHVISVIGVQKISVHRPVFNDTGRTEVDEIEVPITDAVILEMDPSKRKSNEFDA